MKILSWNLFGLEARHLDVRTEAAVGIALLGGSPEALLARGLPPPPMPEALMFQEVVERTFHAHLKPHLGAAGFTLFPSAPPPREYFEVLAVAPSLTVTDARVEGQESVMGRDLVVVEAERDGAPWLLLTSHLESLDYGAPLRMKQARAILQRLRAHPGPAVFGGDTNLRDAEARRLAGHLDAWEACGRDPGTRYTWVGRRRTARLRFDRFWGDQVAFSKFGCLGRADVMGIGEPPSDHLGIHVDVAVSGGRA